jgi:hypothetical protein
MQVGCSKNNPRGKKGLIEKNQAPRPHRPGAELAKHHTVLPNSYYPAVVVNVGTPIIAPQPRHNDEMMSKGMMSNKTSLTLKRARSTTTTTGTTSRTARSNQIHQLNHMQVLICSDDSPCGHYFGRLRIVVGIEDDQVAPPNRKLSFSIPPLPVKADQKNEPVTLLEEPEGETSDNYTLTDLFDGPFQEVNVDDKKTPNNNHHHHNNNCTSSPKRLDDVLLPPCQDEFVASSLVVHGSGIHHPERSNDWDRADKVFQDSAVSLRVDPVVLLLETISAGCTLVEPPEEVFSPVAADESSSFYCRGHESEISIDPLNDFSPRKSTRAKAAAARQALASLNEDGKDPPIAVPYADSMRHKSFQSLQESKDGRSQQSRFNDDSLVVVPIRKSRRDAESNRKPSNNRSKINNNWRPTQPSSPPKSKEGAKNTTAVHPSQRRKASNIMKEYSDSVPIDTIVEDGTATKGQMMMAPSNDSSTTMDNKSIDQEFAQLDLGDQQGIRMVNRAEILTEQRPGLHERKAVLKLSPPRTTASSTQGFSGLVRSKMASVRSVSTRLLNDSSITFATNSPPPAAGLAKCGSHGNRCLSKPSNAKLLDDDASSIEF